MSFHRNPSARDHQRRNPCPKTKDPRPPIYLPRTPYPLANRTAGIYARKGVPSPPQAFTTARGTIAPNRLRNDGIHLRPRCLHDLVSSSQPPRRLSGKQLTTSIETLKH